MASIQWSGLVSQVIGGLNGANFSRNHYGSFIRQSVRPYDFSNQYTAASRQNMTTISRQWQALTEDQRKQWQAFADEITYKNRFGESYTPAAYNIFCMCCTNYYLVHSAYLTDPPTFNNPDVCDINIDSPWNQGSHSLDVLCKYADIPASDLLFLYASPLISSGITYNKCNYRFISIVQPATAMPYNVLPDYVTRFGAINNPGTIFFKFKYVHFTSFVPSLPVFFRVAVI